MENLVNMAMSLAEKAYITQLIKKVKKAYNKLSGAEVPNDLLESMTLQELERADAYYQKVLSDNLEKEKA